MKNQTFLLILFLSVINHFSQNYMLTFSGYGAATTVDSVYVENLAQGTSITLSGDDTLHLVAITGTESYTSDNGFRNK